MFPHRIQIRGHTFDLIFEGQIPGRAIGSRGDLRGDHGSGSVSELTGGVLQRFPKRADFCYSTMVEHDHGSGAVSESQGGRIPDADFGAKDNRKTNEK